MERITNKNEIFNWEKSRPRNILGSTVVITLFSLFLLAGLWGLWTMTAVPVSNIFRSKNWVKIPATVVSCELEVLEVDGCDTYSPLVEYKYAYQGIDYQSSRYNFNPSTSSKYKSVQIIQALPEGLKTFCYVNPVVPSEAVLNRGIFSELLWGLLPLIFFLIGIIVPVAGIYYYFNKEKMKLTNYTDQVDEQTQKYLPTRTIHQTNDFLYRLKTDSPRWPVFTGVLAFTLFWNGTISAFYVDHYHDYLMGVKTDWAGLGFLSFLFLPVGILFIAGTIKKYFTILSPMPVMILNHVLIPLGEELEIYWKINKRTESLNSFSLKIKAVETSIVEGMDSNHPKSNLIFEEILFETDNPQEMKSGKCQVTIPDGLMHSLDQEYNKIEWALLAEGSVRFYPDLEEEFPFIVLPRKDS